MMMPPELPTLVASHGPVGSSCTVNTRMKVLRTNTMDIATGAMPWSKEAIPTTFAAYYAYASWLNT